MHDNTKLIDINLAHGVFPVPVLIDTGLWAGMSVNAKATLAVLWDFHRQFPDACRPSRRTLADKAGISGPSVTKALKELEAIGIVSVIPDAGPRTNTYRLNWRGLRVPVAKASKQHASPFALPSNPKEPVGVDYNDDGSGKLVWAKGKTKGYKLSDGCWVRSAKEVVVHDFLQAWNVPHWCDVSYFDLGILLRKKSGDYDRQSSVDFVVGPNVVIEQAGLMKTQKAATRYWAKLDAKVAAAKKAGWTMIVIPPDKTPAEWLYDEIAKSWAESTIEDAEKLKRRLDKAGWLNLKKKGSSSRKLVWYITDAKARLSGEKPPRKPTGLFEQATNEQGLPVMVKLDKPKLCLMESAGTNTLTPEDEVEALVDEILDGGW